MSDTHLNDDEWFHILQFLPLPDLYHFCTLSKHTSIFLNEDSYVWQQFLLQFFPNQEQVAEVVTKQYNSSYKAAVRDYATLQFDTSAVDPNHAPDFINNRRTVKSKSNLAWNTVRATRKFRDNEVFAWDSILDKVLNCSNAYKIFVGIVEDDFPFATHIHSHQIVGYNSSRGHSLNVGDSTICSKSEQTHIQRSDREVNDGDVYTSVVDTRHPNNSLTSATWTLYNNGKKIYTLPKLDLTGFSPSVALIYDTQVTLRVNNSWDKLQP